MLQVISYYSRRGGLGGVSVVTEKSDFSLTSFLLIRDANADDQVYIVGSRGASQLGGLL